MSKQAVGSADKRSRPAHAWGALERLSAGGLRSRSPGWGRRADFSRARGRSGADRL